MKFQKLGKLSLNWVVWNSNDSPFNKYFHDGLEKIFYGLVLQDSGVTRPSFSEPRNNSPESGLLSGVRFSLRSLFSLEKSVFILTSAVQGWIKFHFSEV